MTFEVDGIKNFQPLDPYLWPRYTERVDNNMQSDALDQLYTITTRVRLDYINPTVDGSISWISIHFADEDLVLSFQSW
jgi:hypothetical protein